MKDLPSAGCTRLRRTRGQCRTTNKRWFNGLANADNGSSLQGTCKTACTHGVVALGTAAFLRK